MGRWGVKSIPCHLTLTNCEISSLMVQLAIEFSNCSSEFDWKQTRMGKNRVSLNEQQATPVRQSIPVNAIRIVYKAETRERKPFISGGRRRNPISRKRRWKSNFFQRNGELSGNFVRSVWRTYTESCVPFCQFSRFPKLLSLCSPLTVSK